MHKPSNALAHSVHAGRKAKEAKSPKEKDANFLVAELRSSQSIQAGVHHPKPLLRTHVLVCVGCLPGVTCVGILGQWVA